ncbi:MAG: tetratricopeptide repeat protein [Acidobacteria bacterium]|nr:tetratricopeptide repeat protein [Acidobacteriota bacterium]
MKHHITIISFALAVLAAALCIGVINLAGMEVQQSDSDAQAEEQESSPEYIEQYEAWEKAKDEPDVQKSAEMLIQFLEKYPQSELLKHAEGSYVNLMIQCSEKKNFQDLEILAEKWLKLHPADLNAIAFLAAASREIGHNEKWIQSLLEFYKIQPSGGLAIDIARAYNKMGNKAKYIEWTETALKAPEFATDFKTRLDIMQFYAEEKNLSKAADYARDALKSADLVQNPGSETKEQLHKVRKFCHETIGKILLEQEKYDEAIKSFQQALALEKSSESCYFIGYCLRMQKNIDDAMIWYARAEKQGGEYAPKAKENLEQLYKALHNDTLIGIEKIYRKALNSDDTAEVRAQ